jgi:hypothetical protein
VRVLLNSWWLAAGLSVLTLLCLALPAWGGATRAVGWLLLTLAVLAFLSAVWSAVVAGGRALTQVGLHGAARGLAALTLLLKTSVVSLLLLLALLSQLIGQYIDWAADIDKNGQQQGVALSAAQQVIARDVGVAAPELVRLVQVATVPFPLENPGLKLLGESLGFIGPGVINNAQVFGYAIYVRDGFVMDTPKLAHELVHVRQIEQSSFQAITLWHLWDLVWYGYKNSRIEAEAFLANEKYAGIP